LGCWYDIFFFLIYLQICTHVLSAKRVPIAFGLYKLQILATVVDDLCSVDELCEKIQELEDLVQSVDIAAFNKI
jgi:translation elongation factor EF-1beta